MLYTETEITKQLNGVKIDLKFLRYSITGTGVDLWYFKFTVCCTYRVNTINYTCDTIHYVVYWMFRLDLYMRYPHDLETILPHVL